MSRKLSLATIIERAVAKKIGPVVERAVEQAIEKTVDSFIDEPDHAASPQTTPKATRPSPSKSRSRRPKTAKKPSKSAKARPPTIGERAAAFLLQEGSTTKRQLATALGCDNRQLMCALKYAPNIRVEGDKVSLSPT